MAKLWAARDGHHTHWKDHECISKNGALIKYKNFNEISLDFFAFSAVIKEFTLPIERESARKQKDYVYGNSIKGMFYGGIGLFDFIFPECFMIWTDFVAINK